MKLARGAFVARSAGIFGGVAILRHPAGAAEFTYKLSTPVAIDHPMTVRAVEAASKVLRDSGGRLDIRVFANSSLGAEVQMMSQLRLGSVEMTIDGDSVIESVVTAAGITSIPFAFGSHQQAWRAMDGPLGKMVRSRIDQSGVYTFAKAWDVGLRQIQNSVRPIRVPSDLRGLKIRVAPSQIESVLFKALGASPAPIDGSEQYTALQTHLVDGTDNPLPVVLVRKLHEIAKYISLLDFMWTGTHMLANTEAWRRLPGNVRDLCDKHFDAGATLCGEDFVRLDSSLQARLTSEGAIFNQCDIPAFKDVVQKAGLYAQWRDHYGADVWTLLERAVGPLH